MSMVRMCVMPGLEKSTPHVTSGSLNSLKNQQGWGWAVQKPTFSPKSCQGKAMD